MNQVIDSTEHAAPATSQQHGQLARILVIDDNSDVLDIFRKILGGEQAPSTDALDALEAALFAEPAAAKSRAPQFQVECMLDGEQACQHARHMLAQGTPFAVAFVDMRM